MATIATWANWRKLAQGVVSHAASGLQGVAWA